MKRYQLGLLLLGALLLSGCGTIHQEEKSPQTGDVAQQEILTGEITTGVTISKPSFPECTPIKLRPFEKREPIDLEQVAINCKYEEGNIYYSDRYGVGGDCITLSFFQEGLFHSYDVDQLKTPVCKSKENDDILLWEPLGKYKELAGFINKHGLNEKRLIDTAGVECSKRFDTDAVFQCGKSKLCQSLEGVGDYGEIGNNYFIFGMRTMKDGDTESYLIINDTIYDSGKIALTELNTYYPITAEGSWVVSSILPNKVILKRYTQGKPKEPYASKPELIEKLGEKDDGKTVIGTYKVKTCEIPL